jgi:SAM-dependent methyltransferase
VHTRRVSDLLGELLESGRGRCLDVGCGTGHHADAISSQGWAPFGVDLSGAQLDYARRRLPVVVGNAARLPIGDTSLDAVVATHIHTDVDDWGAVCREVARVLAPGGRFVYVGAHPCFCGAFAQRRPDGEVHLHPGYLDSGLRFDGPGLSPHGIRARAGYVQRTLGELITPVLESGMRLTTLREDADAPTPDLIGLLAVRR